MFLKKLLIVTVKSFIWMLNQWTTNWWDLKNVTFPLQTPTRFQQRLPWIPLVRVLSCTVRVLSAQRNSHLSSLTAAPQMPPLRIKSCKERTISEINLFPTPSKPINKTCLLAQISYISRKFKTNTILK